MDYRFEHDFAVKSDQSDQLNSFRNRFYFPTHKGEEVVYFTGNSLGLQPKTIKNHIENELIDWSELGVEGHFKAKRPWFSYHEFLTDKISKIVGGLPGEVVCMNQLTVNLHLLMVSFYRPTKKRFKIICEAKAFPSDQYALESQVKFHGFDPATSIVEIFPREGEYNIREEDILKNITEHGNELALVMIGGVNYFTGQVFDMRKITEAAHGVGAYAGFDLAHAAGNIKLNLHNWNVDFACWCSYKYLNSGPGGVAGAFVHEKHHGTNLPQFAGWWGYDKTNRFKMEKGFKPIHSAEAWQLSNAPVLSMSAHLAALEIFDEAGMEKLISKSKQLTGYLEYIIAEINAIKFDRVNKLEIITPSNARGCQLSIVAHGYGKALFNKMIEHGIIADWREPNVIRVAPVPLYNSFNDVYRFGKILMEIL